MKKVLLAGTALLGVAMISSPASAELKLDLGGYFRGYGVYANNDEPAGAVNSLQTFDFRRDTRVIFTGETTTDAGLTVGVNHEVDMDGGPTTKESYMYFSGGWGRVNFGSEDGAAYLLQVAAPSADSNVDGLRVYIQALNTGLWGGTYAANTALEYAHADFRDTERLTYLTPKFNGFQAGVSYAPQAGQDAVNDGVASMVTNKNNNDYKDLWEASARWDGEFEGFGISLGGGYSHAADEAPVAGTDDDLITWNGGLNVAFQGFSLGGAYKTTNNAMAGSADTQTWVVGAGWDNGPYHAGASWLNETSDPAVYGTTGDLEIDRFTVGGGYTYGPGMTFRGAVAFGNADDNTAATNDENFTQVTIGTDVKF